MRPIDVSGQTTVACNPGAVPMLDWIDLSALVLDDAYQRGLGRSNWDHIRKIAAAFSWSRFAPLLVAPVEGGRFAIVDGQHRAHAAALCGIERVPAMIVLMTPREQASAFAWINGQVKRVTPMQMYRAALAAGDGWAVACDAAVSAAGCRLMNYASASAHKKPGQVYCISLIRVAVERGHARVVTAALDALRRYDDRGRTALWSDYILSPWLRATCQTPMALRCDLAEVLRARDPFKVLEAAVSFTGGKGVEAEAVRSWVRMIDAAAVKGRAA